MSAALSCNLKEVALAQTTDTLTSSLLPQEINQYCVDRSIIQVSGQTDCVHIY